MGEQVLCFPREIVPSVDGVLPFNPILWQSIVENAVFVDRGEAEESKYYKQLIPYVFLVSGDKVLSYRRTSKGKENRLHRLCSIGFGGHINLEDRAVDMNNIVFASAIRELKEELSIEVSKNRLSIYGFLNDDSNPVGFVHYGIVMRLELDESETKMLIEEECITNLKFVHISEQDKDCEYETWSSMLFSALREEFLTRYQ